MAEIAINSILEMMGKYSVDLECEDYCHTYLETTYYREDGGVEFLTSDGLEE